MTATKNLLAARNSGYATGSDFCRIFKEETSNLYLFSLLLTADPAKAEQCFLSALEECTAGNRVFKEWAQSWIKRTIIHNAIRMVMPQPMRATAPLNRAVLNVMDGAAVARERAQLRIELASVLELEAFDRFVLVMSVLEGYSDHDSALLLGCTRHMLVAARVRALQQITRSAHVQSAKETDAGGQTGALPGRNNSGAELSIPALLPFSS